MRDGDGFGDLWEWENWELDWTGGVGGRMEIWCVFGNWVGLGMRLGRVRVDGFGDDGDGFGFGFGVDWVGGWVWSWWVGMEVLPYLEAMEGVERY